MDDFESLVSTSLSNDLSQEIGNIIDLEPHLYVPNQMAAIQAQLNLLKSKIPVETRPFESKSADIAKQLLTVCQELDMLKEQMHSLGLQDDRSSTPTQDSRSEPKITAEKTPEPQIQRTRSISPQKRLTEQRIREIVDERIRIALEDFENNRLKRILTDLTNGIERKMTKEFEKRRKSVSWSAPPRSPSPAKADPKKPVVPQAADEAKSEQEVEMLLKKLKQKLNQKEKLVQELSQDRSYQKPTTASMLKKR